MKAVSSQPFTAPIARISRLFQGALEARKVEVVGQMGFEPISSSRCGGV